MKSASITEAKNNLSRLIKAVRDGNTVWITDRDIPVARLVPVDEGNPAPGGHVAGLVRAGLARPPQKALDVRRFLQRKLPRMQKGSSAVDALLADRSESL